MLTFGFLRTCAVEARRLVVGAVMAAVTHRLLIIFAVHTITDGLVGVRIIRFVSTGRRAIAENGLSAVRQKV